jgi:hypothetical protein
MKCEKSRKKLLSTASQSPRIIKLCISRRFDTAGSDYRAPFNILSNSAGVATPDDKFVVTPNSDTPYSYVWMDLRAEPVVITMPKIEKNRYYTGQLIDLYTFNFAYLGTRDFGNDDGIFMIAGPGWKGKKPDGVRAILIQRLSLPTSFSALSSLIRPILTT